MSDRQALPEALRRALEADHRPVRPLPPSLRRAAWVALWAGLLMLILPFAAGMRNDAAALGFGLCWGAAVLQCMAGLAVVLLALREAVPGSGVSISVRAWALVAVPAVQAAVALLTWMRRGMPESHFPPEGAHCVPMESTLAFPALALTLFLAARAYAVRPRWAGVLGGSGAGLLTDGVWHLICPFADLGHTLLWHGASVLGLALFGFLAGSAMEAIHRRRIRDAR